MSTFHYSVRASGPNGLIHTCYGRSFTVRELRTALIASCGGYLNGFLLAAKGEYLEDLIEYLEITCELQGGAEGPGGELWDRIEAEAI